LVFSSYDPVRATEIVAREAGREGPLLPILHEICEAFGYVPPEAVALIAQRLNLSRAEVHGVVTFYPDFRTAPPPRHVVKLCRAEACQARGGVALEHHAKAANGREDVAIEAVYCLGLCASGPAGLIDGRPVARLDSGRLDTLLAELEP
jgi:formate dehydrogenase subunit gamma